MVTGTLIIILLLSVLIVLALCLLTLTYKKSGKSSPILEERLQFRQEENDKLAAQLVIARQEIDEANEKTVSLRENVTRLETQLREERKQNQEKLELLENAREKMSIEFKNLANDILEQKGKAFAENNKENMESILKPLREKIQQFEKKVEETYDRESKERFSLAREIKNLQELNTRISEDAINLTNALKGESKTQGNWGEFVLERLLEESGLRKGSEYEIQVSLKTEAGGIRQPDVIIRLPENKDVIIDSKVSLKAYEKYYSEDDKDSKARALKDHVQSIRNHIRDLSSKNYQNLESVRTLDFIMMFLPVEAAFALAVQQDQSLFTEAFDHNIALVGPTTLMATLRTIQNIWRYEHQNKNAMEIAKGAGALYDKFIGFATDLEEIGKRLDQAQDSYSSAHKRLTSGRGNLVSRVEQLKTLGARASKSMPSSLSDLPDGNQLPCAEDSSERG